MGLFLLVLTGFRRIDAVASSLIWYTRLFPWPACCYGYITTPSSPSPPPRKARAPSCLHLQLFGVMPFLFFDR